MTTDPTPLTQEAENLLAMAEHWRDDCETRCAVTFRTREALYRIEAAAARRAIERVRAVASDLDSRGMGLAALSLLEVIESSAALPRPDEPRVERCTWCGTPIAEHPLTDACAIAQESEAR